MQVLSYKTMHAFYGVILNAFYGENLHALICHPGLDPGSISESPWILGSGPRMTNPQAQMTKSKDTPCRIL